MHREVAKARRVRQLTQYKRAGIAVVAKRFNSLQAIAKDRFYLCGRAVAHLQPNDLRGASPHYTQKVQVFVLGYNDEVIGPRLLPYLVVGRAIECSLLHMARTRKNVR